MRACDLNAGHGQREQILILDAKVYNVHKRNLGPIDIVIEHNRYNMFTVASLGKSKSIAAYINSQPGRSPWPMIVWHKIDVDTPILMLDWSKPRKEWACGEGYRMPKDVAVMRLVAQAVYSEGCGAVNVEGTWFCRSCGRFRGLIYRGD